MTSPAVERGHRIRAARERLEWRQRDLAVAVGVSVNTVGNWESGKSSPRNRTGRLEEVLGISLTGDALPPPPDPLRRAAAYIRQALESLPADAALSPEMIDGMIAEFRHLAAGNHNSPAGADGGRNVG